ncbi:hypothetical protein CMV_009449 [Castanea mollissima]|uniref:Expansin-like EG45 domain-containing protein n=1 Tax=Castanea mollissima TaxID=60419 RepID=A0A8J4VYM2_9ROSI|nr:hypothetical protein CMV_009449 [Castanea mollissima]
MQRSLPLLQWLSLFSLVVLFFLRTCHGDVGTAAHYSPPYLPTTCYGSDTSEFPSSNLFAVAGDGIWDNGAACGRQYLLPTPPWFCLPQLLGPLEIQPLMLPLSILNFNRSDIWEIARLGYQLLLSFDLLD